MTEHEKGRHPWVRLYRYGDDLLSFLCYVDDARCVEAIREGAIPTSSRATSFPGKRRPLCHDSDTLQIPPVSHLPSSAISLPKASARLGIRVVSFHCLSPSSSLALQCFSGQDSLVPRLACSQARNTSCLHDLSIDPIPLEPCRAGSPPMCAWSPPLTLRT